MANTTGKKYGGRQIGTPNKITSETREAFQLLVQNNLPRLEEDLENMEPKERVRAIIQLASFILPKLAAVDLTTDGEQFDRYVTITNHKWNIIDAEKKTRNNGK